MSNSKVQTIIGKFIDEFYNDAVLVGLYADGARALDGKMGAAVYIPSQSFKLSFRLTDNLSIDSAELEAIYQAIAVIGKLNIPKSVIITDSMQAISSLSQPAVFESMLVHFSLEHANNMCSPPDLVWVPSHVGFLDHDVVDQMAKDALAFQTINRAVLTSKMSRIV